MLKNCVDIKIYFEDSVCTTADEIVYIK